LVSLGTFIVYLSLKKITSDKDLIITQYRVVEAICRLPGGFSFKGLGEGRISYRIGVRINLGWAVGKHFKGKFVPGLGI